MSFFRAATMASLLMLAAGNAFGVEQVGSTVSAQDTIEGQGAVGDRTIATADPIYRDEKLRANADRPWTVRTRRWYQARARQECSDHRR